jgi:hypothetical protein
MGGLGNQMFQYAAGKALALSNGSDCKVDIDFFNNDSKGVYTQRKFELDVFEPPIEIANKKEIDVLLQAEKGNLITKIFSKQHTTYYKEKQHCFNDEILKLKDNTYIEGYWQSEKNFKNYSNEIRNCFIFKKDLIQGTENLLRAIQNTNSVSIHVRRGDYVNLKSANAFHGTCTPEYYKAAIELLRQKQIDLQFFIFSDDIEWCKSNLNLDKNTQFVETESACKDLFLMQNCKHHIIANSSFSWWGAWLNIHPHKLVIAPNKWFNDNSIDTKDIYPESWIVI